GETGPKGTRLDDAPAAAQAGRPLPLSLDRAGGEQERSDAGRRDDVHRTVRACSARSELTRIRFREGAGPCGVRVAPGRQRGRPASAVGRGRTQAAVAPRLADNGAGMKAREQRTAAAALLHEAGAERLAEQLLAGRTEAAEIEALPDLPRLGELSDEERKVAELVRMGLKNREIAERIFVSLRTVELRLTAVYRKLDVGSRTELVSRLAGNPRLAAV